jgi:hypothetical protein
MLSIAVVSARPEDQRAPVWAGCVWLVLVGPGAIVWISESGEADAPDDCRKAGRQRKMLLSEAGRQSSTLFGIQTFYIQGSRFCFGLARRFCSISPLLFPQTEIVFAAIAQQQSGSPAGFFCSAWPILFDHQIKART